MGTNGQVRMELDTQQRMRTQRYQLLTRKADSARPLRWEEASLSLLPLGEVISAVVEEIRPYGVFVGLKVDRVLEGPRRDVPLVQSEDSLIRGFCSQEEYGLIPVDNFEKGTQVAVKLLRVDENQRLHVALDLKKTALQEPKIMQRKFELPSPMERMRRLRMRSASDAEADRLLDD